MMQTPAAKSERDVGRNKGNSGDDNSSRFKPDELKYRMNYPKRGRFIIINNKTFAPLEVKLEERAGTDADASKLKDLFENVLQFEVKEYNNLTSAQMQQVIAIEAEKDHGDYDCFGLAVLTYEGEDGHEGKLYGTDCKITIEQVLKKIKTCKSLYGKPKLCFIQACKMVEETRVESDDPRSNPLKQIRLPLEADFLYVCSTIPGLYSWKETEKGSWFVEALTEKLTKLAHEDIDLVRILTRVVNQVSQDLIRHKLLNYKVPSVTSMLTKDLYFTKKPTSSI